MSGFSTGGVPAMKSSGSVSSSVDGVGGGGGSGPSRDRVSTAEEVAVRRTSVGAW